MLSTNKEFLKYGDRIYLHSKTLIELDEKGKNKSYPKEFYRDFPYMQGYLSAKGFFDDQAYFQRTTIGLSLNEVDHANLLNARDTIFVIVPKLKCDFHQEYERAKEDFDMAVKQVKALNENSRAKHAHTLEKYQKKVEKALSRSKSEVQENEQLMTHQFGRQIKYGVDIQLMHFDSRMFLCAMDSCADTSEIGYKVSLTTFFQSGMNFQIHSRFKSRVVGDPIQYGDEINLINQKVQYPLCISDLDFTPGSDRSVNETNPFV
jgi:hypothetical protein